MNKSYRQEEFQAQQTLVDYFSSLSRGKATQILSIVAILFVYFKINNEIPVFISGIIASY